MPTIIKEVIKEWLEENDIQNIDNLHFIKLQGEFDLQKLSDAILNYYSQDLIERINNKYASMDDKEIREDIISLIE